MYASLKTHSSPTEIKENTELTDNLRQYIFTKKKKKVKLKLDEILDIRNKNFWSVFPASKCLGIWELFFVSAF